MNSVCTEQSFFLIKEGNEQFQGHKTIKWSYLKFALLYDKVIYPSKLTTSLCRFLYSWDRGDVSADKAFDVQVCGIVEKSQEPT